MHLARGGRAELGNYTVVATNRRAMTVAREAVWAALADGYTYSEWVVGTREIRDVDDAFPAVGARLHYTVGHGPLRHEGYTSVLEVVPGERMELEIRAWPMLTVRVEIQLAGGDGSTDVTMIEHPFRGAFAKLHNPLLDMMLRLRNVETLRRLESVAARRQRYDATARHR
jgi:uncharacterized protein YndB with AHSA1/START domain